jgi:uncharacterized membrane protein YdjX (TVP38/TMEM64 family)
MPRTLALRGAVVGLIALAAAALSLRLVVDAVGIDSIREAIAEAGLWAPAIYVALRVVTIVIAPLRIPGLEMWAGVLFGTWLGTAYSVLADVIGGSANFWIARVLGPPVVAKLAGPFGLDRLEGLYRQVGGWRGLLFARLVLPGYDYVSYAAGLTPLRFSAYAMITVLGGIPRTYLSVALGTVLIQDVSLFVAYQVALGAFYALAILLHQWWYHRARRRNRPATDQDPAAQATPAL